MTKRRIFKNIMKSGGNVPVVASIIVLVAFIAGLLLGSLVVTKALDGKNVFISKMTGSFADGYNAAKKKIADSGLFPHQTGILSGQIKAINGKEITFTASLANPLDDESLKTRTAVVGDNATITLFRVKTAAEAAADQKTGQQQIADAQSQLTSLQAQIGKCGAAAVTAMAASSTNASNSNCQTVSKDYSAALQKLNQANQLMDQFVKVDKASLSDLKPGMQITVYGEATNQNQAAGAVPAMVTFADISQQQKFSVSLIEARETPAPLTPTSTAPIAPVVPTPSSSLK